MNGIITKAKIKNADGSLSESIDLGVNASNIEFTDGENLQTKVTNIYSEFNRLKQEDIDIQKKIDEENQIDNNQWSELEKLVIKDDLLESTIAKNKEDAEKVNTNLQIQLDVINNTNIPKVKENLEAADSLLRDRISAANTDLSNLERSFQSTETSVVTGTDLILDNSANFIIKNIELYGNTEQEIADEDGIAVEGNPIYVKDVDHSKKEKWNFSLNKKQIQYEGKNLFNCQNDGNYILQYKKTIDETWTQKEYFSETSLINRINELKLDTDYSYDIEVEEKSIRDISNEITISDNGWITAIYDNTEGTSPYYLNYYTNKIDLMTNTNYNIFFEVKSISGTGEIYINSSKDKDGQFQSDYTFNFSELSNNSITNIIALTQDSFEDILYGLKAYICFKSGQSGSIEFRLSILEDTTIIPETFIYEPYVGGKASPSPDYPQDIPILTSSNNIEFKSTDKSGNNEISLNIQIPKGEFVGYINNNIKDIFKIRYSAIDNRHHLYLDKALGKDEQNNVLSIVINNIKSNGAFNSYVGGTLNNKTITFDREVGKSIVIYELEKSYVLDLGIINMPLTQSPVTNAQILSNLEMKINLQYNYLKLPSPEFISPINSVGDNGIINETIKNADNTLNQVFNIPVQKPFRKMNDIKDTFIKKGKIWYERHYFDKIELTGEEDWTMPSTGIFQLESEVGINAKSNYFNADSISFIDNYIKIIYIEKTTIDDFKSWLKSLYNTGKPVEIVYQLENYKDIECTDEQIVILNKLDIADIYEGTTYVTSEDTIKAELNVEYFKSNERLTKLKPATKQILQMME